MDLEGSDGRERGEDDTNFERQSALFALAVADVLLVNIWCHDIGREQGSGKPLLRTIFQVRGSLSWPRAGCVQTGPSWPSAGMYVYVGGTWGRGDRGELFYFGRPLLCLIYLFHSII